MSDEHNGEAGIQTLEPSGQQSSTVTGQPARDAKIVQRDALRLAGLRYQGKGEQGAIPAMWDVFFTRVKELPGEQSGVFYGVAREMEGVPVDEGWEYLAGAEVPSFENLPAGMVGWEIPAVTCAVLPAHDVPDIDPVCAYFYQEWLPKSEYDGDAPLMIEEYPASYSQDRIMYLHFPIRAKQA